MSDNLICFDLDIRQCAGGYQYDVSFYLRSSKTWYGGSGTAPSPEGCFDAAMKFLSESIQGAEEERTIVRRVEQWAGAE